MKRSVTLGADHKISLWSRSISAFHLHGSRILPEAFSWPFQVSGMVKRYYKNANSSRIFPEQAVKNQPHRAHTSGQRHELRTLRYFKKSLTLPHLLTVISLRRQFLAWRFLVASLTLSRLLTVSSFNRQLRVRR